MNATMTRKHLHAAIKQVDRSRREIKALLTHQVVDADGEVVVASGVDWSRWTFNAPMLYQHDKDQKVGNWEPGSLRLEVVGGAPGWTATGRLFSKGALADQVYDELQEGAMGVSIGFLSKRADFEPVALGQTGRTFRAVQIIEASLVNLQSCPTCVVLEKSARRVGHLGGREEVLVLEDDADPIVAVEPAVLAAAMGEVLRGSVAAEVRRQAVGLMGARPPDDAEFLVLDEDAPAGDRTLVALDPDDVRAAMTTVFRDIVTTEVRSAINALRGRVD